MSDGTSLINLGDLTKPATVLIDKIADATGAIFRPHQIIRIARAEAEAEKIRALANIEISEIQQRGLVRFIEEQGRQQENMESVTAQSIPELKEDAKPKEIENDWLANFFDKCKLISDKEMQSLWSRLLAGEANNPGAFSKRTVQFVSNLDKSDAQLFTNLCCFGWYSKKSGLIPLIYTVGDKIYTQKKITYTTLSHLDDIGLVKFQQDRKKYFSLVGITKSARFEYFGTPINVKCVNDHGRDFSIGNVFLTKIGHELAPISGAVKCEGFIEYVIQKWQRQGFISSCPL